MLCGYQPRTSPHSRLLLLALSAFTVGVSHALYIGRCFSSHAACASRTRRLCAVDVDDGARTQDGDAITENAAASTTLRGTQIANIGLGPFASTLGRWDSSEGEPDFLQEMDWHPTSKMSAEERAAAEAELIHEGENDEEIAAALLGKDGFSEETSSSSEGYVEQTYEYIKYCDDFEIPEVHPEPKTRMPSTWQEYQFLQEQAGEPA